MHGLPALRDGVLHDRENTFNPKKARIRVNFIGFPEVPVPVYTRHCDACGGKPACLRYCPAGCISFSPENSKLDSKKIVLAEQVAAAWLKKITARGKTDEGDR